MEPQLDYAKRLLAYYFRTAFEAADLPWNEDNEAEIHSIIDAIGEAAR